jgi:hypothetical protein
VKTLRETATETCTVVCDSETLTEKTLLCDAQTEAEPPKDEKGTGMEVATQQDDACMTDDELDEKGKDKKVSVFVVIQFVWEQQSLSILFSLLEFMKNK